MKQNSIQVYLQTLKRELWRRGLLDNNTLAEIESHLLESVEKNLHRGLSQEAAEQEALRRFGSIKTIAATFEHEKERMHPMQKVLTALAVLAGLFFVYVDTRPTWDDTGVLAGGILVVCGLMALIGFKRPWLLALVVGVWIPFHGFFVSHNFGSVLALIIAFVGAYAGWSLRLGIRKIYQPL